MLNVIAKAEQTVAAGQNVVFTNTRVKSRRCGCSSGWLNHIEGSGIFTITNRTKPSYRGRITVQRKRNSGGSRRDRAYAETETEKRLEEQRWTIP